MLEDAVIEDWAYEDRIEEAWKALVHGLLSRLIFLDHEYAVENPEVL